jgi:hypothetical protein
MERNTVANDHEAKLGHFCMSVNQKSPKFIINVFGVVSFTFWPTFTPLRGASMMPIVRPAAGGKC